MRLGFRNLRGAVGVAEVLVAHGALPVFNVAVAGFVVYARVGNFINETVANGQFRLGAIVRIILIAESAVAGRRQPVLGAGGFPCLYEAQLSVELQLVQIYFHRRADLVNLKAEILIGIVSCIGAVNVKRLARAERRGGRMNGSPSVALVQFCLERPLHGFPEASILMVAGQDVALRNERLFGVELHEGRVIRAASEVISGSIGVVKILCCVPIG